MFLKFYAKGEKKIIAILYGNKLNLFAHSLFIFLNKNRCLDFFNDIVFEIKY